MVLPPVVLVELHGREGVQLLPNHDGEGLGYRGEEVDLRHGLAGHHLSQFLAHLRCNRAGVAVAHDVAIASRLGR